MPLEFWSTFASVGTFIVIAATAIAALLQLHHMAAANKVAAIQIFANAYEGPQLRDAFHFVRTELEERLQDPAFRQELRGGRTDRVKHPKFEFVTFLTNGACIIEMALSIKQAS